MTPLARLRAWPLIHEDADPFASEVWLEEGDDVFARAWNAALRGGGIADLEAVAIRLGLGAPFVHEERAPEPAPRPVADALLADVLEDFVPDVVPLLDVVLGPWADERPPRPVLVAAAAALVHAPVLSATISAARAWAKRPPRPALDVRASVRATRDAPPMLWRVRAGAPWEPLLPLAEGSRPGASVSPPRASLGGGDLCMARLYPCADGSWHASGALGLPAGLPVARLQERLEAEGWRLRRARPAITWEGVLRARTEVLYRTCATWAWWC